MLSISWLTDTAQTAGWWSPTALGAYATLGAVLVSLGLGTKSIEREEERAENRREVLDRRVGGYAFAINRQIRKWLDDWRLDRNRQYARHVVGQFDAAESRVEQMAHFAPEGSDVIARKALSAAERFWVAADRVNDVAAGDDYIPVQGNEIPDEMEMAKGEFEDCASLLEEIVEEVWPDIESSERPGLAG